MDMKAMIKGWLAREPHIENPEDQDEVDVSDTLCLFPSKPKRFEDICWTRGSDGLPPLILPKTMFADIRWENEPVEVELTIKRLDI